MLGIDSWGVLAAYWLSLFSAVICVGYGLWRWNHDPQAEDLPDLSRDKTLDPQKKEPQS